MSELQEPGDIQEAIHDLLLANYIQNRQITDLLYVLVENKNPVTAKALLEKHQNREYFYPDVFEEGKSE